MNQITILTGIISLGLVIPWVILILKSRKWYVVVGLLASVLEIGLFNFKRYVYNEQLPQDAESAISYGTFFIAGEALLSLTILFCFILVAIKLVKKDDIRTK